MNEWPLSRRALELLQSATTPTTTTTTQATTTTATTSSVPEPDGFVQTPPTTLAGAAPGDANVPPDAPDAAVPNAEETCEGTGLERARCALRGALNTHCSGDAESEKRPRNLQASTIERLDRFAADHNERRALRGAPPAAAGHSPRGSDAIRRSGFQPVHS